MSVSDSIRRYILFVGTLEPRKNLLGLLHAWNEVKEGHPDVSLVIAGSTGRVFKELNYPASPERVRWAGYVPETELLQLYAGAELFVLPSVDEGFGLTALEAMACGTPVIVSDGGALPEVVGNAGLVFHLAQEQGLGEAMSVCLTDGGLRASLKEKGLERAQAFSWEKTAEAVWKNLNEI